MLPRITKWWRKNQALDERLNSHVVNLSQNDAVVNLHQNDTMANDAVVNLDQNDTMANNSTGSATEHADQSEIMPAGEIPSDLAKVPNPESEEERRLLSNASND